MPFRTARANFVLVMPGIDRIYFRYGNGSVAAYQLSRFFTRLEAGEQLTFPVRPIPQNRAGTPELFLNWDEWFNPELSSWKTFNIDGATRMTGFDVDDKGYVYVASTIYGWGVVKDDLGNNGGKMMSMFQKFPGTDGDAKPGKIAAIKGATRYYAYLSSPTKTLWDVTDRANPLLIPVTVPIMSSFAKSSAADRIAIVNGSTNALSIYSSDTLAAGGGPLFTDPASYQYVTGDGTNFFALKNTIDGKAICVITPSGTNGYTIAGTYPIGSPAMNSTGIHYGDGYIVLSGETGSWDLRVFKVGANLVPTVVTINASPTPSDPNTSGYFRNYYGSAPPGYVTPGYINMLDGTVYKAPSGKVYLIVCASGIGDVYELAGGDSITTTMDGRAGTVNANAPTASNAKTFFGDPVQFTAHSSSANVSTVLWNFGNPENTSGTNNQQITGKEQPITYQYSNLAPAGLGTKTVVASSVSDANIHAAATVTLSAPTARFALAGAATKYLFTQPNASSSAPIVLGDSFVDASDGTVESHYASWTLDSTTTKAKPDALQSVGTCGAHSLTFGTFYGPYDPTALVTSRGGNFPVSLGGAVNYSVRPFAAGVQLLSSDATTITFASSSRFTTDPSVMQAAQITGFSYKWEIVNGAGAPIAAGVTGTTTAVPNFVVSKASLNGVGTVRVRLTLTTNAPFQGSCAGLGMESSVALSNPLSAPDPKITSPATTECQGTPCTFTASSISGIDTVADNWTYKWSLVGAPAGTIDPNTVVNASTFTPLFLKTGVFTVQVTATNAVGVTPVTTTFTVNVAASPCGTLNASSYVPTWLGPTSGCSPFSACTSGENVSFRADAPLSGGYNPNCTTHTYTWTFPDGTATSNDPTVNHIVTLGGTVKVTVNNGTLSYTYTVPQPLTIATSGGGGGGGGGGGNPNPCGTMTSTNIQPFWNGATCPTGGATCGTNDAITFDVQAYQYDFSCAPHTFIWKFDDNTTSGSQRATHTFLTSATHQINLTVTNPYGGRVDKTFYVTTTPGSGQGGGGSCPTMTTSNIAIAFTATGCSSDNPNVPCKNGDGITFNVTSYTNYDFSCSPSITYSWNFGDGIPVAGRTATHAFSTSGQHPVSVTISVPGMPNFTRNLTMSTSDSTSSGSCGTINPNLSLSITYSNPSATCNQLGGDCKAGDVVSFSVIPYQYDINCGPHTFDWDFGDGSPHLTGKDVQHQYQAQGTYSVKCVVNNGGPNVTLTQQVSVKGSLPATTPVAVSYAVAPLTGVANGYLFTPSFDPPQLVAKWQWDFGDGQKSSMITGLVRPISWIYADSKTYTVTLTAYDSSGQPVGVATHPGELKRRSVRH